MNFRYAPIAAALAAFTLTPALAEPTGDAEAGAKVFAKCQTCHVIADADGAVLGGRNAKTGPNLYGMPGRAAGTYEGFAYGDSIIEVGAAGYTWDEEGFVAYVANPVYFLREKTGSRSAKSKMSFRLTNEKEARNVYAYIASLSPAVEVEPEAEAEPAAEGAAPASN